VAILCPSPSTPTAKRILLHPSPFRRRMP
jgi:hypothetical protein